MRLFRRTKTFLHRPTVVLGGADNSWCRRLVLEDFGLIAASEIDLTPRQKRGRTRPVVLFAQEWRGQVDHFEAILLCLYGKAAVGERPPKTLPRLSIPAHPSHAVGLNSKRAAVTVIDFGGGRPALV